MFMPGVWILWSKKKIVIIFQNENWNSSTLFIIFIVKSLQKEQNSTNLLLSPPICRTKSAITPKWFNSLDTNSNLQTYETMNKHFLNVLIQQAYISKFFKRHSMNYLLHRNNDNCSEYQSSFGLVFYYIPDFTVTFHVKIWTMKIEYCRLYDIMTRSNHDTAKPNDL